MGICPKCEPEKLAEVTKTRKPKSKPREPREPKRKFVKAKVSDYEKPEKGRAVSFWQIIPETGGSGDQPWTRTYESLGEAVKQLNLMAEEHIGMQKDDGIEDSHIQDIREMVNILPTYADRENPSEYAAANMKCLKKRTPVEVPLTSKDIAKVSQTLDKKGSVTTYVGEDIWVMQRAKDYNSLRHYMDFTIKAFQAEGKVGFDKRLNAYVAMWRTTG
jgi:hypothetical protein